MPPSPPPPDPRLLTYLYVPCCFRVIRLFVQFDRDRDQYLSVAELRAAVSNLDAAPYDHDHVEKILNESDLNKDGRISFDEFAYHMMQEEEEHQH